MVPDRAVIETMNGPTVFVVDDRGAVNRVEVDVTDAYQNLRVLGGENLKVGQLVLVDGLQLVRPGMKVKAEIKPLEAVLPHNVRTGIPTLAERLNSPSAQPYPMSTGTETETPPVPKSKAAPKSSPAAR